MKKRRKVKPVIPDTDQPVASRPVVPCPETGLLLVLAVSILVLIVSRAWSLSMTYDEAYTVCVYAAHGTRIFSPDDFLPNNHVFHTVLVWLMFQIAPWQEMALRTPAVAGGIGCVGALVLLGLHLFRTRETGGIASDRTCVRHTVLLVAIVLFHPIVFQFLSFARGYGLSLFFSLIAFDRLVRALEGHARIRYRTWILSGLFFGLSVASNLTAALIDTSLILSAFAFGLLSGRLRRDSLPKILPCFVLPGAAVVLALYFPIFLNVSFRQFDYAIASFYDFLLDFSCWTLGNTEVVPDAVRTRLLLGIPISGDTFWLLGAVFPFLVLAPYALAVSFFTVSEFCRFLRDRDSISPGRIAFFIVQGGLAVYLLLLGALELAGRPVYPRDRTGVVPIAYFLLSLVLTLHILYDKMPGMPDRAEETGGKEGISRFRKGFGRLLAAGIVLAIVHFLFLFRFPYYHNFWYGDTEIREMMRQVKTIERLGSEKKVLVHAPVSELSIQYYMKKYDMIDIAPLCVYNDEQLDRLLEERSFHAIFMLPAEEKERLQKSLPVFRLLHEAPYRMIVLVDAPRDETP